MKLRMVFLWAALTSAAGVAAGPREVPIAFLSELPGSSIDSPIYLPLFKHAVEIALAERSAEFAKLGLKIVARPYYTTGKINTYRQVESALHGDTLAAVGLASSDEALMAVELVKQTDYLIVSPYATSTRLLAAQPNLLLFAAPNDEMARALEAFVETRLKPKRLTAIVAWDSGYSQNFYLSLSPRFREKVGLVKIQDTIRNIQQTVKETLAQKPELILLPNFPVSAAALIKALVEAGYRGPFIGPDSWGEGTDPRFALILEKVPFTGYTIRQFSRFRLSPREQALKAKLLSLSPLEYGILAALYYDSTNYLLDLIHENAAALSRHALLESSRRHRSFQGATGLSCLSSSDCPRRQFNVLKVNQANFEYLGTVRPEAR